MTWADKDGRRDSGTHTPNAPCSSHPCTSSPRTRAAGASPADCTQKPARPFYRSLADQTQSRRPSSVSLSVSATLVVTTACLARPHAVQALQCSAVPEDARRNTTHPGPPLSPGAVCVRRH